MEKKALTPAEVLAEHGIGERTARAVITVAFGETTERVYRAMSLRKIEHGSNGRPRLPWAHVKAYAEFCRALCEADSPAGVESAAKGVKPTVVCMLHQSIGFVLAGFGQLPKDGPEYLLADLSAEETATARSTVAELLLVDSDGTPAGWFGVRWFADWRKAIWDELAPRSELARDIERLMLPLRRR